MDQLSTEMFSNPTVTVGNYQKSAEEFRDVCQSIFGRVLDGDEIADFISAPDGAVVTVQASSSDGSMELRLAYKWFDEQHEYLVYTESVL